MATAPQFATTPNAGTPATLTAANTATDGTGSTGRALILTAEAVTGGGTTLPGVLITPLGTNVKTNLRFFLNNGSDPETAGNNAMIWETHMPATTVDQDDPALFSFYLDFRGLFGGPGLILKGHATTPARLYVTLATAVSAGHKITPINAGNMN